VKQTFQTNAGEESSTLYGSAINNLWFI